METVTVCLAALCAATRWRCRLQRLHVDKAAAGLRSATALRRSKVLRVALARGCRSQSPALPPAAAACKPATATDCGLARSGLVTPDLAAAQTGADGTGPPTPTVATATARICPADGIQHTNHAESVL